MQTTNKHVILYHRADADGWMSNALTRHYLMKMGVPEHDISSIGWDFSDPDPDLSTYDPKEFKLWIVDLPPNPVRKWVEANISQVYWIDHHRSSIIDPENARLNLQGLRYEGMSACRLVYAFFEMSTDDHVLKEYELQPFPAEPQMVFLIGLRDVWRHNGTEYEAECDRLNLALIADPGFRFDWHLDGDPDIQSDNLRALIGTGEVCEKYAQSMAKEASDRGAMLVLWPDHPTEGRKLLTLALNTQGRGSMTLDAKARELDAMGAKVDALMVYAVGKNGEINASLYHAPSAKHLDLSVIAKARGGGGHPGACGFKMGQGDLLDLLSARIG